jgi:DNA-binding MarR family transcriptional regulator
VKFIWGVGDLYQELGSFFNPSPEMRELNILRAIAENPSISQERLSREIGIVPSMVHRYLSDFERTGLIMKTGETRRSMSYVLLDEGRVRLQYLTVSYLADVARIYAQSRNIFGDVLDFIATRDFESVYLYGAGIVGKMLSTILLFEKIDVLGFIDDASFKKGSQLNGIPVFDPEQITGKEYDAIIIASFAHAASILAKAEARGHDKLYVFEISEKGRVSLIEHKLNGGTDNE